MGIDDGHDEALVLCFNQVLCDRNGRPRIGMVESMNCSHRAWSFRSGYKGVLRR